MPHYDRIDVSEENDVKKTSELKDCNFFRYWYFLNKWCKLQLNISNECHDLIMMSMNFRNIAILDIKDADYLCFIGGLSQSEVINLT